MAVKAAVDMLSQSPPEELLATIVFLMVTPPTLKRLPPSFSAELSVMVLLLIVSSP
jgi:hypothetical protein